MSDFIPEDGPRVPFGLFVNGYKEKDSHPDYVGDLTITDTMMKQVLALRKQGKAASVSVAGWRKETRNGDPYVSCQLQVDTYKTAKRYKCEESEIRNIIDGVASEQKRQAPPKPSAPDPFLGAPAPTGGQASAPDPFDDPLPDTEAKSPLTEPDDELPF